LQRENRRLAAIVAADIAGYSRLIAADEEGTLRALRNHRAELIDPLVERHGGRIANTAGDSLLLEFPSAVDAVRCAVAVQEGMAERNRDIEHGKQVCFRIGINVGDVIAQGTDLLGDGVNIAARLEGICEPGNITLSDDAHRQVRNRIDASFEEDGPQELKNIAEPVIAWRWQPADAAPGFAPDEAESSLPLPEKPSIAVLPFNNMSGDPEQEYFADGIAEDIITLLSRFHWFFVIARNSSFSYKGTSPDIRAVARDLGVQYVLEGSVRKSGERVRITAQLIEAESGRHVWADRYDRQLNDIFEVQDEITQAITAAVAPSFVAAEIRRTAGKEIDDLNTWDLVMRGSWHLWRIDREGFSEAKRLFALADAMSPNNAIVNSHLAITYAIEAGAGLAADPVESRDLAYHAAQRAIAVDDHDAWAHAVVGWVKHLMLENETALRACRRALDLNPNLAFVHGVMSLSYAHLGDIRRADEHVETAMRLSPRDPSLPFWLLARTISPLVSGDRETYLARAREMTEASPQFVIGWRHLAVACASLGRLDEAKAAFSEAMRLAPDFNMEMAQQSVPIADAEARELYFGSLKELGLPG
jgi:adenylate cyclase